MKKFLTIIVLVTTFTVFAAEGNSFKNEKNKDTKYQTVCPVMGEPIDNNLYYDYKGHRIFVCCKVCIDKVKENPEKYLKKIRSKGEKPFPIPKEKASPESGAVKGTPQRCNPNTPKSGGIKGTPGCCCK